MRTPIAVLISDVHYSLSTLKVADAAMRMAIAHANRLDVPLVVAGDLHDTKANLRGECVNAMINTFEKCSKPAIVLIGNHDLINERSSGEHSLEFLRAYASIVKSPVANLIPYWSFLPYDHDKLRLRASLKHVKSTNLIMHQGVVGAHMGEYIQDRSALDKEDLAGLRVISGHYHARQSFELPDGGKFDYIGNPYTRSFSEADDPTKGYQVLYDDGSLDFNATNLRTHKIIERTAQQLQTSAPLEFNDQDLLWVKITGTLIELENLTRAQVAQRLNITHPFKLDFYTVRTEIDTPEEKNLNSADILDKIIDSATTVGDGRKSYLKTLWRSLI